jgi:hypothetical protein
MPRCQMTRRQPASAHSSVASNNGRAIGQTKLVEHCASAKVVSPTSLARCASGAPPLISAALACPPLIKTTSGISVAPARLDRHGLDLTLGILFEQDIATIQNWLDTPMASSNNPPGSLRRSRMTPVVPCGEYPGAPAQVSLPHPWLKPRRARVRWLCQATASKLRYGVRSAPASM